MRILFVWFTALVLFTFITFSWYLSQPIVIGVARALEPEITNPSAQGIATIIEFVSYVWGPIFDVIILGWAIISSQRRDVESELYG